MAVYIGDYIKEIRWEGNITKYWTVFKNNY